MNHLISNLKHQRTFIILLTIGMLFAANLSRPLIPSQKRVSVEQVIDRPGEYLFPQKFLLKVTQDNNLIGYSLLDSEGNVVAFSNASFSSFQRWYFLWDSQKRLWVYSSDIGTRVWVLKEPTNRYEIEPLNAKTCLGAPGQLLAELQDSVRKLWKCKAHSIKG